MYITYANWNGNRPEFYAEPFTGNEPAQPDLGSCNASDWLVPGTSEDE